VSSFAPPRTQSLIAWTLAIAALLGSLMQALVVPVLADLPAQFGVTPAAASWAVTATLISGGVSALVLGSLGDRYGKRRMILIALLALAAGSAICALAPSIGWFIVGRTLQGIATAVLPLAIGVLRDVVESGGLYRRLALLSTVTALGGTFGFTVAAVLVGVMDWRLIFGAIAVIAAGVILLVRRAVPHVAGLRGGQKPDVLGVVALTIGLVLLLLGLSNGVEWGWGSPLTLGSLIGGAAVLIIWGSWELRIPAPIVQLRQLGKRPILLTNSVAFLAGVALFIMMLGQSQLVQLPVETGVGLGQSAVVTGLCFLPGGILALFLPRVASRIIESRGPRRALVLAQTIFALGPIWLLFFRTETWHVAVAATFVTVGLVLGFAAAPALLMLFTPPEATGEAVGANNLFRTIGGAAGSAIMGAFLTATAVGGAGAGITTADALVTAFLLAAAASVAGAVMAHFAYTRG
jgi:MFS family permease